MRGGVREKEEERKKEEEREKGVREGKRKINVSIREAG